MALYLNDDQKMLQDSAEDFKKGEGNVAHLREFRDKNCTDGFSHALWKQFAEMGFSGILIAEDEGGLGLGHVEAGVVLEEIGRNLTPSPFLTTAVRSEEHTSELQSRENLVCRLLLEKKKISLYTCSDDV